MAYYRKRRKISNTEFILWPIVLLAIVVSGRIVTMPQSSFVATIGLAVILALGIVAVLITRELVRQRKTRQGLRELNFDHIDAMTGIEFEKYIGAMLEKRGFKAIRYTKTRDDDGIDITARQGNIRYAIQVKRYSGKVGKEHIFPVTSARNALGFDEAMVVTNSYFTRGAQEYAQKSRCELVSRDDLARWRADNEVR